MLEEEEEEAGARGLHVSMAGAGEGAGLQGGACLLAAAPGAERSLWAWGERGLKKKKKRGRGGGMGNKNKREAVAASPSWGEQGRERRAGSARHRLLPLRRGAAREAVTKLPPARPCCAAAARSETYRLGSGTSPAAAVLSLFLDQCL